MATFDEFWGRAGPGMIDMGVGLYNRNRAQKEAAQRLATAQGPLYQQAMGGAGATLAEAGSFNPDELAAGRFGAQEAMLKPVQDKQLDDLMRMLHAKGMLGTSNYNPGVEGIVPNGQAMNPRMAAFFAAQNADRAKRSQASLLEGQGYANNLVSRASNLRGIAGGAQQTGISAQSTQPSRAAGNAEFLRGLLKTPGLFKGVKDLFSGGFNWAGGGIGPDHDFGFDTGAW
jgi:hypothetical protein